MKPKTSIHNIRRNNASNNSSQHSVGQGTASTINSVSISSLGSSTPSISQGRPLARADDDVVMMSPAVPKKLHSQSSADDEAWIDEAVSKDDVLALIEGLNSPEIVGNVISEESLVSLRQLILKFLCAANTKDGKPYWPSLNLSNNFRRSSCTLHYQVVEQGGEWITHWCQE
jgi:hypothetical protein